MNILFQLSSEISHWVHNLSPFIFQFPDSWPWPLGGNGLRWYGTSYICGFIAGVALLFYYYKKERSPYPPSKISDLTTYMVIGVMAGGRLGYLIFYDLGTFLSDPLIFFRVWEGGMASHGGFLGVLTATILFSIANKQSILNTGDLIVTVSSPGLFFGRIANFINGELWGHPTQVSWAVIFPEAGPSPRHPSQLYEAFTEGFILFIYMQLRFWGKLGKRPANGQLIGEFLVGYSIARVICENFRVPDASLILGMPRGQFYSLFSLAIGIVIILTVKLRSPQKSANR